MDDYVEILDTQIEPDAPLTAVLAGQWRDNPIAIAKGSPGAPFVLSSWTPYDSDTAPGNSVFYNHGDDGSVANVVSPDFEEGFDYRIVALDLIGPTNVTSSFRVEFFRSSTSSYSSPIDFIPTGPNDLTNIASCDMTLLNPRRLGLSHSGHSAGLVRDELTTSTGFSLGVGDFVTLSTEILRVRITPATGNISGGRLCMFRRLSRT